MENICTQSQKNIIYQTLDYSIFKFREDNRIQIARKHVDELKDSIKTRNLLNENPIQVNADMEVIDGQHRLIAAQELNIPIYYKILDEYKPEDIIRMNISKSWCIHDFFNFFCKNNSPEYLKLKKFLDIYNLPLTAGIDFTSSKYATRYKSFRNGEYIFNLPENEEGIEILIETQKIVSEQLDRCSFVYASKFCISFMKFYKAVDDFKKKKWLTNVHRLCVRLKPFVNIADYIRVFINIYNFGKKNKTNLELKLDL